MTKKLYVFLVKRDLYRTSMTGGNRLLLIDNLKSSHFQEASRSHHEYSELCLLQEGL